MIISLIRKLFLSLCFLGFSTVLFSQDLSDTINKEGTILLDVRTPEEYSEYSANGAINIPIDELEARLSELDGKKDIVVFCRKGIRAAKAENILKQNGFSKVHQGKTVYDVTALQTVSMDKSAKYEQRPTINHLKKNAKSHHIAVSLGKNGELKEHSTSVPTALYVIKGNLDFYINGKHIKLKEHYYYEIPKDIVHRVVGKSSKNLFLLIKEK